ncbi:MAG: LicD family protein [Eubacteriales bacterium]|nr:LicD family protein [Eubacteriales bacterium]
MQKSLRDLQLVELEILKEFLRICNKYHLRYYALGGTLLGAVRHKGFIPWDDDVDVGMPRTDFIRFEEIVQKELPEFMHYYSYKTVPDYPYYVPRMTDGRVKVVDDSAAVSSEKEAWIDIFPLDGMPGGKYRRKLHCFRLLCARVRMNYSKFSTNINLKKEDRPFYERVLIGAGRILPVEKLFKTSRELRRLDKLMQKYPYDSSPYLVNFMGIHKLKEMFHKKYYGKGAWYDFEDIRLRGPKDYDHVLRQMYGEYWNPPDKQEMNHHNTRIKE